MQTARTLPLSAQMGRTVAKRYRLERLLGEGCMGAVFEAWDSQERRPCALKVLHPETSHGEMAAVRFTDEAQLVARLCHPNIVEIWDSGRDSDGIPFLVMELLRGQSLHGFLQKYGALPMDIALDLIKQVGSALHAVHLSGIVHRDLKPQNILLVPLSRGADRWQAKVIDFGLAKLADHSRAPQRGSDGMLIGTASYLAPEAWRGISAEVDARADQWALAVIAYRMLSGCLPYDSADNTVALGMMIHNEVHTALRELVPSVPQHIQDAIDRALQKDKDLRFPSVLQFVQALHQLPQGTELRAPTLAEETVRLPALLNPDELQQPYAELACEYGSTPALSPSVMRRLRDKAARSDESAGPANPVVGSIVPTEELTAVFSSSTPTLVPLPAVNQRWRERSALLQYLLPVCSFLGALATWSGVYLGGDTTRVGLATSAPGTLSAPAAAKDVNRLAPLSSCFTLAESRAAGLPSSNVGSGGQLCPGATASFAPLDPDYEPPPAPLMEEPTRPARTAP